MNESMKKENNKEGLYSPKGKVSLGQAVPKMCIRDRSSTAKNAVSSTLTTLPSKQYPTCSARKVPMHGGPMKQMKSCQQVQNVRSAAVKNSEKKPTSWTYGSIPVLLTQQF